MPSTCCVVYCTSGYRSNPEKISLFQFPKNEILREKWEKSIPRANLVVNPKTVICEKHFTKDQIVRTWESGSGASKVMVCYVPNVTYALLNISFLYIKIS